MARETCSTCGGRTVVTDYSKKIQTSASYYKYGDMTCPNCGGAGTVYVPDPQPARKPQPSKASPKKTTTGSTGSDTAEGVFGFIGLLVGGIGAYNISEGNWVATIIAGIVVGYIASKTYKLIIAIIIILIIIYIIANNNN